MIAQDLVQAAENAIIIAKLRPHLLPAVLDIMADETDRLLEMEGEPAGPLRDAGCRIACHLVAAHVAHAEGEAGAEGLQLALETCLRHATLALRLTELLPLVPAPAIPAHWRPQVHARPSFAVIQGGRA